MARALLGLACIVVLAGAGSSPARAAAPGTTHVLMISGGGSPQQNFASHLSHLRQMAALVTAAGIPRDRITIISADGNAAGADLARREVEPDRFWLLEGTELAEPLEEPLTFASSSVDGFSLLPATRATVQKYFAGARTRLRPGDTLFLYVTDHGTQHGSDPLENRITLWGRGESLSVRQLRAQIETLPAGVRVVSLMSQCFSGAFARIREARGVAACGYFASTADRPAYGCYPETEGREKVGHSFEVMEALAASGRLPDAHAEVLVRDQTPDVPLRSSDDYLHDLVARAARAAGQGEDAFTDGLLREAWKDRGAWEQELRLLDRIGQAFGLLSPRSLSEIADQRRTLEKLADQLRTHGKAWGDTLGDMTAANFVRLLGAEPEWRTRLAPRVLRGLAPEPRRAMVQLLLQDLWQQAGQETGRRDRMQTLAGKADTAQAAAYRVEVRLAVLLRLRTLLAAIAGRVHLASAASKEEVQRFEALRACEDFSLPLRPQGLPPQPERPFPPLDDELRAADAVAPAWLGVVFKPLGPGLRQRLGVGVGASQVEHVVPGSPAAAAGLEPGDVIAGAAGRRFGEPNELRTFTALSGIGESAPLETFRDGQRRMVTIVFRPFPSERPAMPGPPVLSSAAPPLSGVAFRGALPAALGGGKQHLLFFWATWCVPCKEAVPAVLAFARERGVSVLAISDEPAADLEAFFRRWRDPFPDVVVSDETRKTFVSYGVSGTPTFVLVDGAGKVQGHAVGYSPVRGLRLPGVRP